MRRLGRFIGATLALLILGGALWLAYRVIDGLPAFIRGLQSEVAVAIVAGSVTIAAALISVTVSKWLENRSAVIRELRLKKIPIYEELIDFIFRFLHEDRIQSLRLADEQKLELLAKLTQKSIVWSSDSVIVAYGKFRAAAVAVQATPDGTKNALFAFEDLMLAIRKDLGHSNTNVDRGTLLQFFVNDIDEHIPAP